MEESDCGEIRSMLGGLRTDVDRSPYEMGAMEEHRKGGGNGCGV